LKGRFEILLGDYVAAYFDGKKAVKYMKKTLEMNPQIYDAYLGLGLYEYYAGTLPLLFGFLGFLVKEGDAHLGLEYLYLSKEYGLFARETSTLSLISIYLDEKSPFYNKERAKKLIEDFKSEYPNYPDFQIKE